MGRVAGVQLWGGGRGERDGCVVLRSQFGGGEGRHTRERQTTLDYALFRGGGVWSELRGPFFALPLLSPPPQQPRENRHKK